MSRKKRIMKKHILDAALDLVKHDGFEDFTARRIAESLNASTQPIYKDFKNMDDLREHLLLYIKTMVQEEVFKVTTGDRGLVVVCANYMRFAKKKGTLFCAIFMGKGHPADDLNAYVLNSIYDVLENMSEFEDYTDRKEFMEIIWPAVHGAAVLSAQGQLDYHEEEIDNIANSIIYYGKTVWKDKKVGKI